MSAPLRPCPFCGKETKEMPEPAIRICSLCRKVSKAVDCTPENAPKGKKSDGFLDVVGPTDAVQVGLAAESVPPAHPCPHCGKETKEGHKVAKDAPLTERVCRECGSIPL